MKKVTINENIKAIAHEVTDNENASSDTESPDEVGEVTLDLVTNDTENSKEEEKCQICSENISERISASCFRCELKEHVVCSGEENEEIYMDGRKEYVCSVCCFLTEQEINIEKIINISLENKDIEPTCGENEKI